MAEKKISELTAITGNELSDDDNFIVVDTSATQTKKLSKTQLFQQILSEPNFYTVTQETGTSFTFDIDDANYFTTFNNSSAIAVTIPTEADVALSIGTKNYICQTGSGAVTVSGAVGVTVTAHRSTSTAGVGDVITIIKINDNEWVAF
jgi:hypothetical protein